MRNNNNNIDSGTARALTPLLAYLLALAMWGLAVQGQTFLYGCNVANNDTARSLAYDRGDNKTRSFSVNSEFECAAKCSLQPLTSAGKCHAFSFVANAANASANDGRSSSAPQQQQHVCQIVSTSTWHADGFVAHPSGRDAAFYVRSELQPVPKSEFVVVPAAIGSPMDASSPSLSATWPADCKATAGPDRTGILVALRNNVTHDTSFFVRDFKCRLFDSADLRLDSTAAPAVLNAINESVAVKYSSLIRQDAFLWECPAGQVVTAVYSWIDRFKDAQFIRCHKLAAPWFVNTTDCRHIDVYQYALNSPPRPNPLIDNKLTGTAAGEWGAQCGNWITTEALTGLGYHYTRRLDLVKCCRIYRN